MYKFGAEVPANIELTTMNTQNLPNIDKSGMYNIYIISTSWKNFGEDRDSVQLSCVALDSKNNPYAKVSFSVALPSNKAHQLAYFLNLRDSSGCYYIPAPFHHEGVSSKTGKNYSFDTIEELHNKHVYALIEYKGLNEKGYHQYKLVGFCNKNGYSPADEANNCQSRYSEYQDFLNTYCKQSRTQPAHKEEIRDPHYQYYQQQAQDMPF